MSIFANSRYADVEQSITASGTRFIGRVVPPTGTFPFMVVHTAENADIVRLAGSMLGDTSRWVEIANLNPEIRDVEFIPANTRLRVPVDNPPA